MMSDAANNRHPENEEELQGANSSCINRTTRHLPCLDVFSSHCSALCLKNEREEVESPDDYQNSSPPWAGTSASSQERGISSVVSAPHLDLSVDINYRYPYEDMRGRVDFSRDACRDEFEMLGTMLENGATLKNPWQLGAVHEGRIAGLCVGNDVPVSGDYFSTSENQQNLLVSLSSRCVMKSTVCERSKLLRIKFYGNFDKPLGRYLCDDLFDQRSCCRCCKEPPEAHVKCFTHQQGSLTISVKRLSSMKLPGEQDGRIWMWHRCLKCTRKDGVPPPTRRVIMSDPAWRLSFGKFLELSFSNHATTNRVASCGHSLQRDCLRFFGLGSMVAFFRYSPVDILSVRLPPSVLQFACQSQQEWFRREAAEVSSKVDLLHGEVLDVLHGFEQKITSSVHEPSKASLCYLLIELKDLLKNERFKYEVLLQPASVENFQPGHVALDIMELNRLRHCLLIDSYIWDRRIYLLDSKVRGSSSEIDAHLLEISTHNDLVQRSQSFSENVRFDCSPEGVNRKTVKCHSNELVDVDLSVKPVECHVDPAYPDLVYDGNSFDVHLGCGATVENTSLKSLPLPGSSLSDKIDLAWTGTGQSENVQASNDLVGVQDNLHYRKLMFPFRVYSFDSALRVRDEINKDEAIVSLHLSSVGSFDAPEDRDSLVKDSIPNIRRAYSQNSQTGIGNLKFLFGHMPLYVRSASSMVSDGARLLLPQTGPSDIVVAVYDKEPTSVIAYALNSKEHVGFVTCSSDQQEERFEGDQIKDLVANLWGYNVTAAGMRPFKLDDIQSQPNGSDEALFSGGSVYSDSKQCHFRYTFDDESSIPAEKAKFSVTCYFAKQFDALRKKCCPTELDFICSLSRCRRWNAQGGKSNVYFAKSLDERFIIKQVTKTELESFEEFSPRYFNYMMESINSGSHTCLAKILGIYQVTIKHLKGGREVRMDLMVMENLFFGMSISRVYDLKGCSRSRYNCDTTGRNKVMLDLNLVEALRTKPIFLGSKSKRNLERAIWNDTSFLASVDVMDYSLLVGVDEERKELVLGIIDFLRQYTWDKHLETWVKASGILGGPTNVSPTVISPKQYKKRFRKAMSTYFLTVPDQWYS
uniref:1-phosphatidylinositol 3-phosphate 5-kinase FAB1 n=2 Tax=Anthurium amnicola TaxID=1678845 RepID=A0A1D1YMM9_9ARAE